MSGVKEVIRFIIILLIMLFVNTIFIFASYKLTNKDEQTRLNNKKIAFIGIVLVGIYLFMNLLSTCYKVMTDFSKDYLVQNIIFERGLAIVLFILFFIIKFTISARKRIIIKNCFPYEVHYQDDGQEKYYIDAKYKNLGSELAKIAYVIAGVFALGETVFVYNNIPYFKYSSFIGNYGYLLTIAIIYLIVFEIGKALDGELAPDSLEKIVSDVKKDRFNEMLEEFKTRFKNHLLFSLDKDDAIKLNQNNSKDDTIYSRVFTPIIEGKSIIIETELLSSLNDIIPPLINLLFGTNRRILFITSDDADSQATFDWLRERNVITDNANKVVQLFKEGESTNILNDTNVNICIGSVDLLLENHEIIKHCDTIFAINVDNIIANSPVNLSILAKILATDQEKILQYIFFANAVNDLKQSIESVFLNEDFLYYVVRSKVVRNFHSMFFAKDRGEIQHKILPGLAKDSLGSVLPLLVPPVRYDINHLYGFSSKEPYEDEMTNLHIHIPELKTYVDHSNVIDIDGMIKFKANEYFIENEDSMVVTYDDSENNLVLLLNNYLKYANSRILLNIVSNKYLLRDYLVDNIDFFMQNAGIVGKIVPYQKDGKKLSLFKLINELCITDFEEDSLIAELNKLVDEIFDIRANSNPESFIKTALHDLIKEVFNEDINLDNYLQKDLLSETVIKQKFVYKLSEDIKYQLPRDLFTQLRFEASDQHLKMLKRVPIYEVYQNYANNQYVVFDGKSYCIESVDAEQGIVKLRTETMPSTADYRFKKDIDLTLINYIGDSDTINYDELQYEKAMLSVNAKVRYEGYYSFKYGLDFKKDYRYIGSNDRNNIKENNYLNHKSYLITFSSKKIASMTAVERLKTSETIVFLLNELFKTIYYGVDQYLILRAVCNNDVKINSEIYNLYSPIKIKNIDDSDIDKKIALLAMEDTGLEKGILDSLIIKIDKTIIPLLTDYLEWVLDDKGEKCRNEQVGMVNGGNFEGEVYVKSYNGERIEFFDLDRKEFIKSCGDNIADNFNLTEALEILKTIDSRSGNSISVTRNEYISRRILVDKTVIKVHEKDSGQNAKQENDKEKTDGNGGSTGADNNSDQSKNTTKNRERTKSKESVKKENKEDSNIKSSTSEKDAKPKDLGKYEYIVKDGVTKNQVVDYLSMKVFDPIINSEKDLGAVRTNVIKIKTGIKKDNWNVYSVVNYIINLINSDRGKQLSNELREFGLPNLNDSESDFVTTFGIKKQ